MKNLFLFLLIVIGLSGTGCLTQLTQLTQNLAPSGEFVNYALAKNGATAVASGSTPDHEPGTVINGITSSKDWDKGEGWEMSFQREHMRAGMMRYESRMTRKEQRGGAWVEVRLPEPKRVNRMVIYTLDSQKYPVSKYGIYEGNLQVWDDGSWKTIARVKNGKVEYLTTTAGRTVAKGRIVLRFQPILTNMARVMVFRSNDRKVTDKTYSSTVEQNTARIIEVELTGYDTIDPAENKAESELDNLLKQ
jgi:hypothetical protein